MKEISFTIENDVWNSEFDKLKNESSYVEILKEYDPNGLDKDLIQSIVIDAAKYVYGNVIGKFQVYEKYARKSRNSLRNEVGKLFASNGFAHTSIEYKRNIDADIIVLLNKHMNDKNVVASKYIIQSINSITPYIMKHINSFETDPPMKSASYIIEETYEMVCKIHGNIFKGEDKTGVKGMGLRPSRNMRP